MRNIYINNKLEIVDGIPDLLPYVEESMGAEARDYLSEEYEELKDMADNAYEKVITDAASWEREVESNGRAFIEIQDEIEALAKMERFSRKAVLEAIRNIKTIISNQI